MAEVSVESRGLARQNGDRVKVWDPLVRIFHWSLVGLFTFSFFTGDEWKSAHILSGYAIGSLIAIRMVSPGRTMRGFATSSIRHAPFSAF